MRKNVVKSSRLLTELMESAQELSAYGLVSKTDMAHMRLLCTDTPDYPPERVVAVRTNTAKVSQSVFAALLNVSVSTVQKWESPNAAKHPSGAAAKLLQIVEARGLESLLI